MVARLARLLIAFAPALAMAPAFAQGPDAAMRDALALLVDCDDAELAIVAALSDARGTQVVGCGAGRKADGETRFDASPFAPVLTGIVLADYALRRELGLDDAAAKHLTRSVKAPAGAKPPTLADLATHATTATPGEADALLRSAIASRARKPFADVLRERVLAPLRLSGTSMDAAGAVHSTANDLLRFAQAQVKADGSPVGRAMAEARKPRRAISRASSWGLGWVVEPATGAVGHLGLGANATSYVHADPATGRAVVVLANFADDDVGALGAHLVDAARYPAPRSSVRREVYRAWRKQGVPGALDRYSELRAERDDGEFRETDMDAVGHRLLRAGLTEDALALFVLNVVNFAQSPLAHGSLGAAYLAASRVDDAIASYAQALKLAVDQGRPEAGAIRERYEAAVRRAHGEPRPEPPKLGPGATIKW